METIDRVAVITGAASGIGKAVSKKLVGLGVKAIGLVDLDDGIVATADQINRDAGLKVAVPFQGNVTDEKFRSQVYDKLQRDYGIVSICVPCAGITRDALAVKVNKESGKALIYPVETFNQVMEINLIASVYWALELLARMAEHRAQNGLKKWHPDERVLGTVIFIGSVSSQGNKGQISYATTKAGLEGAAATLSKEAIYHGVRCGVIHPGFTDTPMVRALGDKYIEENILKYTQLGRLIQPEEIADAICFMISNSAVSGELWADAGWHPSAA